MEKTGKWPATQAKAGRRDQLLRGFAHIKARSTEPRRPSPGITYSGIHAYLGSLSCVRRKNKLTAEMSGEGRVASGE